MPQNQCMPIYVADLPGIILNFLVLMQLQVERNKDYEQRRLRVRLLIFVNYWLLVNV
jgi:hypothetical protein